MRERSRCRIGFLAAIVCAPFLVANPGRAAAAPTPCPTAATDRRGFDNWQDIDADPHVLADQVVGVPASGPGVIDIRFNDGTARQRIGQSFFTGLVSPGADDRFGSTVAFAEVDANLCADLLIGAPNSDSGTGAVVTAIGSTVGIQPDGASRVTGQSPGEHFGAAIALFASAVFIGAPDRTVSGHLHAGAVDWFTVDSSGQLTYVRSITQDTPGVPGVAETGDRFGSVLSGFPLLLIGDPDEAIGGSVHAGTVTALNASGITITSAVVLSRDTAGVYGIPESGDRFGYAVTQDGVGFHIGVPGARVGSADGAGAVYSLVNGPPTFAWRLSRVFTQNSPGVPDVAEAGDHFGAALATGAFTDCATLAGAQTDAANLAIGAPGEDAGSLRDIGTVTFVPTGVRTTSTLCSHAFYQGSHGRLPGAAEPNDRLGAALGLSAAPFDESTAGENVFPDHLMIGVPGEDVGSLVDAGGVVLTSLTQFPHAVLGATAFGDSAGPTAGQAYGTVPGR